MHKIEHLGLAVSDISAGIKMWESLLGVPCYKTELVEREGVETAFFEIGNSKIELLQGTNPDSAITKFIAKKGEGFHHIAFAVTDIVAETARLQAAGLEVLGDGTPRPGADNKLVVFFHPRTAGGLLIELCQEIAG